MDNQPFEYEFQRKTHKPDGSIHEARISARNLKRPEIIKQKPPLPPCERLILFVEPLDPGSLYVIPQAIFSGVKRIVFSAPADERLTVPISMKAWLKGLPCETIEFNAGWSPAAIGELQEGGLKDRIDFPAGRYLGNGHTTGHT